MKKQEPYYRIFFSFYNKGQFNVNGSVYLYLPKGLKESRISDILEKIFKSHFPSHEIFDPISKKYFIEESVDNLCINNYELIPESWHQLNKGYIYSQIGDVPLKYKFNKKKLKN